ncbi:membrane dipeptidase [Spongiivirga sp. MCCC 1A20706]|uniref:membrane dipeptidase n=1 Tax=Spongiivirga sp. MCCC 1A20706 TaxID=3160963 RepID=UPI003977B63B
MQKGYIDLHCHPALKPFGKSFRREVPGQNTTDISKTHSVWHQTVMSRLKRMTNRIFTLTKFTQTDFSSVYESGSRAIIVSLYPLEKPFVDNAIGKGFFSRLLTNLAMGVSQKRIKHVQRLTDYFPDLQAEYEYYKQLDNQWIHYKGAQLKYQLITNFNQIKQSQANTISVLFSVEGGHALGTGIKNGDTNDKTDTILKRVDWLKKLPHKQLFITMAHHFYNELCGHAKSLGGMPKIITDQSEGMNSGFTKMGEAVMRRLLDKDEGHRILIDIKHMSIASRKRFYTILSAINSINNENIPIVVSHGAANGLHSFDNPIPSFRERAKFFMQKDINFYDDELIMIAKSQGLFGIQLDERRVTNKKGLRKSKHWFNKAKRKQRKAFLVWRQIEHIADVLDSEGLRCWNIQAIGSDFDGIVDPINEYWTANDINELKNQLLPHAAHYLQGKTFNNPENDLSAEEIIDKAFTQNAMLFLEKNF